MSLYAGEHIDILAVNTLSERSTDTARMTFVAAIESAEQLDRPITASRPSRPCCGPRESAESL